MGKSGALRAQPQAQADADVQAGFDGPHHDKPSPTSSAPQAPPQPFLLLPPEPVGGWKSVILRGLRRGRPIATPPTPVRQQAKGCVAGGEKVGHEKFAPFCTQLLTGASGQRDPFSSTPNNLGAFLQGWHKGFCQIVPVFGAVERLFQLRL